MKKRVANKVMLWASRGTRKPRRTTYWKALNKADHRALMKAFSNATDVILRIIEEAEQYGLVERLKGGDV